MQPQQERLGRRLSALFAADVAGYSRLMSADEAGTLRTLTAYRAIMDGLVAEHGGRIANTAGDSVLTEFASAVDAVQCALATQERLAEAGAATPAERRLRFRIAVHVGDVVPHGTDLLGDGVNVCARLQELSEPGGVCVSGAAHEYVRRGLPIAFEDLGAKQLKNIGEPVRAFRVRSAAEAEGGAAAGMPIPAARADKPSIAVLPFTNMSGDPEQEYFADGVVEDIITGLSRFPSLLVIARNSSFTYKGRAVDVKQVGRELGARYVLEGSIRRAGNKLRLAGQLIEAETNAHLWADRFDGELSDIFALQDEITERVVGAIEPNLMRAEVEAASRARPSSVTAYDLFLRALAHGHSLKRDRMEEALRVLADALRIDGRFGGAASLAAIVKLHKCAQGWSDDPATDMDEALDLVELALLVDPNDPTALGSAARIRAYTGQDYDGAFALVARATELCPNSASAWSQRGSTCVYLGRAADAVASFERAIRLSPKDLLLYEMLTGLSVAYIQADRYEEAIGTSRRSAHQNPYFSSTFRCLAAAHAHLGRMEEAQEAAQHLLRLEPNFRISAFDARSRWKHPAKVNYIAGMRLAGLPE